MKSLETQVVMLGGTQGSTHHAVVPPHCAGSSSVASLPCGHTREKEKRLEGRRARKEGRKYGRRMERDERRTELERK